MNKIDIRKEAMKIIEHTLKDIDQRLLFDVRLGDIIPLNIRRDAILYMQNLIESDDVDYKEKYEVLLEAYAAQNTMIKEIFSIVVEMNAYRYDTLHHEHRAWQIQQKVDSSLNEYSHTIYKLEGK